MAELLRYIAFRVGSATLTLLGVAVLVFIAIHFLPGNFEDLMAPRGPAELRAHIVDKFGLDKPLVVQFFKWLSAVVSGDLGISLASQEPITKAFRLRVPVTIELAIIATLLAACIGIPLGLWSGLKHKSPAVSGVGRMVGSFVMSVPDFVVASFFLYIFSRYSLGLTVGRWVLAEVDFIGHLKSIALPAITLSAVGLGLFVSTARNAVIAILSEDFVMAAIARGDTPGTIVRAHILRNMAIPLITTLSIYLGSLIGGAIIVEYVYSVPGLGRFMVQGLLNRDYPVVQAAVLIIATAVVLLNMAADISYAIIDPRIRSRG